MRSRLLLFLFAATLFTHVLPAQVPGVRQACPAFTNDGAIASGRWFYHISLLDPQSQIVHVRLEVEPTSADLKVQLPVWNALYQVRDFSQYVRNVKARDAKGIAIQPATIDKTTWSVPEATTIEYDFEAEMPGPFGAEFNAQHAFLNLAMLLMYPVGAPKQGMRVEFGGLPRGWNLVTPLPKASQENAYCAENYDRLVDSPVEMGRFRERDFESDGARFRVVVDGDPSEYSMDDLDKMLQKIVSAEITWMNDRPFEEYMFLYHFPKGPGRGGMEHAYGTAIEASAPVSVEANGLASVTAHEFFHLWNVKRIRPQSLEPIDYTKENYTGALWFSEGVTSTVADYALARAGILNEKGFLLNLADGIQELESRPAHLIQSAEASSLDAWLEKYPSYRAATRSVSYYNKGELLGLMLDLAIREASDGKKSLRDLFQFMNEKYAKQERFFADSDGVRGAAEAITGKSFREFFDSYVAGVKEIPYDTYLRTVGLRVKTKTVSVPDAGLTVSTNFSGAAVVDAVRQGSEAERQGIRPGDVVRELNGSTVYNFESQLSKLDPGTEMRVQIARQGVLQDMRFKLGIRNETAYEVVNAEKVTAAERTRRNAWIRGEAEANSSH